jgi:hypothetical protein
MTGHDTLDPSIIQGLLIKLRPQRQDLGCPQLTTGHDSLSIHHSKPSKTSASAPINIGGAESKYHNSLDTRLDTLQNRKATKPFLPHLLHNYRIREAVFNYRTKQEPTLQPQIQIDCHDAKVVSQQSGKSQASSRGNNVSSRILSDTFHSAPLFSPSVQPL